MCLISTKGALAHRLLRLAGALGMGGRRASVRRGGEPKFRRGSWLGSGRGMEWKGRGENGREGKGCGTGGLGWWRADWDGGVKVM